MTQHTDQERAEFEEAFVAGMMRLTTFSASKARDMFLQMKDGEYVTIAAQQAWLIWQAARRAPVVPVPQIGYRLLGRGEAMQEGDEFINDDAATWSPIQRGFVKAGATWGPNWQPMRRPIAAAPQPPAAPPASVVAKP